MKDMLKSQQAYERELKRRVRRRKQISKAKHILGIIACNMLVALIGYVVFKAFFLEMPL